AWAGTYKNKSLLRLPDPSVTATTDHRLPTTDYRQLIAHRLRASWRYLLALAALGFNLFSVSQLRADYYSAVGGWGWLASLVLLLAAFIGHRPNPGIDADEGVQEVEDRTDPRIPRKLEIAIFLVIFALALGLRLYRLGDW